MGIMRRRRNDRNVHHGLPPAGPKKELHTFSGLVQPIGSRLPLSSSFVVRPNFVTFGGSRHHALFLGHAIVECSDFVLTLRFVALLPFEAVLHLGVDRSAFVIRQDPCPIKLHSFHVVGLAPPFATPFQRHGHRSTSLRPPAAAAVAAVLQALSIRLCLCSTSCRSGRPHCTFCLLSCAMVSSCSWRCTTVLS